MAMMQIRLNNLNKYSIFMHSFYKFYIKLVLVLLFFRIIISLVIKNLLLILFNMQTRSIRKTFYRYITNSQLVRFVRLSIYIPYIPHRNYGISPIVN